MSAIREDASLRGSPVKHVLETLERKQLSQDPVSYKYLSGTYGDGMPYNGVIATLKLNKEAWDFAALTTQGKPHTVRQFVRDFKKTNRKHGTDCLERGLYSES